MKLRKWGTIAIVALVTVGVGLAVATAAILSAFQTVPLSGTISAINVGVYSDSACTQNCISLNAGNLSPGGAFTQTVYIKNTGNVQETLSMTVNNWNPANAASYLTLTWNRQNTVLGAGQSIQATLTLTAASNTGTLTSFSCSVTFTGTQ